MAQFSHCLALWNKGKFRRCLKELENLQEHQPDDLNNTLIRLNSFACQIQGSYATAFHKDDTSILMLQTVQARLMEMYNLVKGFETTADTRMICECCLHNVAVCELLLCLSNFYHSHEARGHLEDLQQKIQVHFAMFGTPSSDSTLPLLLSVVQDVLLKLSHDHSTVSQRAKETSREHVAASFQIWYSPPLGAVKGDWLTQKCMDIRIWNQIAYGRNQLDPLLRKHILDPKTQWIQILQAVHLWRAKKVTESLRLLEKCDIKESAILARCFNVKGACFAQQGCHELAIQHYHKSISADPNFVLPLYNIALLYQRLNKNSAELQILELLARTLSSQASKEDRTGKLVHVPPSYDPVERLSLASVLYLLASRAKELERYDKATNFYFNLIHHLLNESRPADVQSASKGLVLREPPHLIKVYTEAAYCLLQTEQYQDCVTVCENVLSACGRSTVTGDSAEFADPLMDFDDEDDENSGDDDGATKSTQGISVTGLYRIPQPLPDLALTTECVINCLLYMSSAKAELGQRKDALEAIHSGITKLKHDVSLRNAGVQNPNVWQAMSQLYAQQMLLLVSCGNLSDAVTSSTQAVLCDTENVAAMYNHTLLLFKVGRLQEAATEWLKYRSTRQTLISGDRPESSSDVDEDLLKTLDTDCLKIQDNSQTAHS